MYRVLGSTASGGSFSDAVIDAVWNKAAPESGLTLFRKDACGASMRRDLYGKQVQYGWQIDHIKPASKGGTDDLTNLQPLQWENNANKSDDYPNWSCKIRS